jgi:hypothetical protein
MGESVRTAKTVLSLICGLSLGLAVSCGKSNSADSGSGSVGGGGGGGGGTPNIQSANLLCQSPTVGSGSVLLYANSASVTEMGTANVTLNFTINLTSASSDPVTVEYQTSDSTGVAGTDYVATNGTITFAPGATVQTIPVTVMPDLKATQNRTFFLTLCDSVGATIATPKLSGTIIEANGPQPIFLSIENLQEIVGTSGSPATFPFVVTLNRVITFPVTVTASTQDLTAKAGVNYVATTQVLTIPAGSTTVTFPVSILGATTVSTKYFLVNLTSANVTLAQDVASGIIEY